MTFDELNLDPRILKAIAETGYTSPTPIQAEGIPPALEGKDVLGIAQTGTGKTAAFSIPMINRLVKGRARARMPRTLVLAPTRELAAQVAENFETYSKHVKLSMALLIGGVSFKDQDQKIDRGVDVLIATPGRLLDHVERGKLMLSGIDIMVVDEADRMLDMGFIPDIERIFKMTPFTRQTLFFSATMPPEITRLTQEFLSNPVRVEVARASSASETITQGLATVNADRKDKLPKAKRDALRAILNDEGDAVTNAIIFCNRKRDIAVVEKSLKKHGFSVGSLHGDLDQRVRMATLDDFRENRITLLVASDVAARGLDIPAVSHVFNFDVPTHSEDYVHRIGRTGRAGRSGKAYTLATPVEAKYVEQIETMLKTEIPKIDLPGDSGTPAPAPEQAEEEKPKASRTRRGSRPKSSRAEKAEEAPAIVEQQPAERPEPEAKPDRREPRQDKVVAKRDEPRSDEPRGRRRDGRGRDNDRGPRVKGLGDHMPAFMLIPIPTITSTPPDGDDQEPKRDAA